MRDPFLCMRSKGTDSATRLGDAVAAHTGQAIGRGAHPFTLGWRWLFVALARACTGSPSIDVCTARLLGTRVAACNTVYWLVRFRPDGLLMAVGCAAIASCLTRHDLPRLVGQSLWRWGNFCGIGAAEERL